MDVNEVRKAYIFCQNGLDESKRLHLEAEPPRIYIYFLYLKTMYNVFH